MKIAVTCRDFLVCGGAERVIIEQINGLSKRHDVTLSTGEINHEFYPEIKELNAQVQELVSGDPIQMWTDLDLSSFDAAITHNFPANLIALKNNNVVWYCHSLRSRIFTDSKYKDINLEAIKKSKIIANSNYTAKRLKALGLDPTAVIPPAINADRFRTGDFKDYFLVVSRGNPRKRIDLPIKAWKLLPSDIELIVVSDLYIDDYARKVKALAEGMDNVKFESTVPFSRLKELYTNCMGVVFVPKEEDFGIVPLEAMASGKPVIASDEGGCRETVVDGKTGFLIDPTPENIAEKVNLLWEDKALAQKLGAQGKEQVEKFSWDAHIAKLEAFLSSMC